MDYSITMPLELTWVVTTTEPLIDIIQYETK